MKPDADYLRALRHDYWGEIVGEVDYRIQALVSFDGRVRAGARELAAVEREMRALIGAELAKHGVSMGRQTPVWAVTAAVLLPVKLALPSRAWVWILRRVTGRAIGFFERQRTRFGERSPELFARLVEHEVRQHEWARAYLGG